MMVCKLKGTECVCENVRTPMEYRETFRPNGVQILHGGLVFLENMNNTTDILFSYAVQRCSLI